MSKRKTHAKAQKQALKIMEDIKQKMNFLMKIACLLSALILTACQQKSYEDCVLEQMKNGNSDTAARIIARACEEKYGLQAYKQREEKQSLNAPAAEAAPAESTQSANANGDNIIGFESELYPERYGNIKNEWSKVKNDTRYINSNEDKKILIRSGFFNEVIEPYMKERNMKDSLIEKHRIEFMNSK